MFKILTSTRHVLSGHKKKEASALSARDVINPYGFVVYTSDPYRLVNEALYPFCRENSDAVMKTRRTAASRKLPIDTRTAPESK